MHFEKYNTNFSHSFECTANSCTAEVLAQSVCIWKKCLICLDFLPVLSSGEICQCVLSNLSWILWYMWCRHPRWIWLYSHFGTRRWCYQCCRTSSFHFSIRRSCFEGKKKSYNLMPSFVRSIQAMYYLLWKFLDGWWISFRFLKN